MEYEDMSSQLTTTRPAALSRAKKDALWGEIEKGMRTKAVVSPYYPAFLRTRSTMTALMIALMLMLGAGGTAVAANDARPGDILFSIDQTLEEVRLALASSDESRARLKIKYAEERLGELRSILAEQDGIMATSTATSSVAVRTFAAEADVFTDTTIVKVEINDRTTTFVTTADTKDEVVDEIVRRYTVDRTTVATALDFEIEDRASRAGDLRGNDNDAVRVGTSVDLIDALLTDEVDDAARAQIYAQLVRALTSNDNDDDTEVRIDDDGDRVEIRSEDGRIEIREKDGETEIRMRRDDDDSADDDDRSSADDSSSSSSFEAEADVFTDTTIVKVEINDRTTTFVTTADTKDEVVDEIVRRYTVDRTTVATALDFEIEDRASRAGDDNSSDNSSDDDDVNRSDDDDDNDDRSDDDSNDSNDSTDDSDRRIKVEVRVEQGRAEVRVENGGNRIEYETTYVSESQIVADIAARSGLSTADVRSNLDLEVKD
jgi:hypothetical protein